jgi:hypothetical protein
LLDRVVFLWRIGENKFTRILLWSLSLSNTHFWLV